MFFLTPDQCKEWLKHRPFNPWVEATNKENNYSDNSKDTEKPKSVSKVTRNDDKPSPGS